ncbi:hypothetical protein Cylst_3169 [Cylindrospermum stagnale PCC 7417]|uniref:Uncharacterized protein n=1 Tax=Cylindrospermum stagnale PCC 7417 TaxID=56107 RepID=K9X0N3_9NOST|nr:hypothetical protein [Cylindrospermum stagnale]AFZ25332.1 hypothetical protein Cylst_3169 [Cylindrospermum stagnale PCC 7417]
MSDIAILKKMIKEEFTVSLAERKDGTHFNYSVTLTETQDNYSVTIDGMPNFNEVIIINAENFLAPIKVFNGSKGECKRADFIMIADTDTEKIIICIEMKKTKGKKIIQQLKGAKCFVSYCQEIGKAFWTKHNFLDTYQYRFISIGHIPISKEKTRHDGKKKDSNKTHDCPEKMLIIKGKNSLQFDSLI